MSGSDKLLDHELNKGSRLRQLFRFATSLKKIVLYGVGGFVIYIALTPLVFLIWTSFWSAGPGDLEGSITAQHIIDAYTNPTTYEVMMNSFFVASGSLIIALLYGVGIAWLLARTDIPTKGWIEAAVVLPMAVSPFFYAFMYIFTYGPELGIITGLVMQVFGLENAPYNIYSLWGVTLVTGVVLIPTTYLLTAPAFADMDPSLEEVGLISGAGYTSTMRSITLPLIKPALLAAIVITFLRGLGIFSIPAILGFPADISVFATEIWRATDQSAPPEYGYGAALSLTFLVIASVLIWYNRKVTARSEDYMTITGEGFQPRQFSLGRWRWPLATFLWVNILTIWILPVIVMVVASFHPLWLGEMQIQQLSLVNYYDLLDSPIVQRATLNTLLIASVGGVFGTILMLLFAYYVERTEYRFRGIADFLSISTLAAPGIILGVGVLFVYLWLGSLTPINIYGTKIIMILGMITLFLPTISRMAIGNVGQIHTELEESAYIFGATWYEQMREIFLPLSKGVAGAIFFYLFVRMLRHLAIVIILFTRGNEVLSVLLFQEWFQQANVEFVAALSSVFVFAMLVILFLVRWAGYSFYEQH